MINLGHVINDLLLYHAHTCFAWSLLCVGTNEWIATHNFMALDCASKQCCRLAKVISFYLRAHVMNFKNWLLLECCFVFFVRSLGPMKGARTLKSDHTFGVKKSYMVTSISTSSHLSPSHDEDVLASRTTLFEGGGDDVGQPNDNTMSSKPPRTPKGGKELHGLQSTKAYAWMRRRKRHGQGEEEGGKSQAGRPPSRPRPAPRPGSNPRRPASQPAQAGP